MTTTDHGTQTNIRVDVYGSLYLLTALDKGARNWLLENVYDEAIWWGCSLVVEGAYFPALFDALCDAGYIIRGA